MSISHDRRLDKLERARTDIHSQLVVYRHGEDAALFSRTIRHQDPAEIQLRWPERKEVVESYEAHTAPEVETDLVQHR